MARFILIIEDDPSDGTTTWRCKMNPVPEPETKESDLTDTQMCGVAIMDFVRNELLKGYDVDDMCLDNFSEEFDLEWGDR